MKKLLIAVLVVALILIALPFITGDLEKKELNNEVRKELGLKSLQLTDGMVHYDVSGPENGEIVVLVHGNAAPYFSWNNIRRIFSIVRGADPS